MTLTTELSPDMYEGYIKGLQGELDRVQADNENLQKEFDAALVHIEWLTGEHKTAQAEMQRYKLMYQENSRKYIDICKEISQLRNDSASLQVAYDELEEERQRLQNIVYRLKGAQ